MKLKPILAIGSVLTLAAFTCESSIAATFQWDADGGTGGAQDGGGTWNAIDTNWINGTNVAWADTNSAVFGAGVDGTYAVSVELNPTASNLVFNNSGYTLSAASPQTITVTTSSSTANATALVVAAGKTATIGDNVTVGTPFINQNSFLSGGGTLIIEDGGTLRQGGSTSSNILYLNGTAVQVETGGTITTTAPAATALFVNGELTVNGGSIICPGTLGLGQGTGGALATLTLNSGDISATSSNGIRVGSGNSSPATPGGTVNLNGGNLTIYKIWKGSSGVGTSILNLNGTTIQASVSTPDFMQYFSRANVRDGGAIIDLGNFNCTIKQDLRHSDIFGDAATDGGLEKFGIGTLSLTGPNNDYNGGTIIHEGALGFDTGSVAPASGLITIESAGCLKIGPGYFPTVTSALGSGLVDPASTGSVALVADSSENIDFTGYPELMLGARANSVYSGQITAAGGTYHLGGSGGVVTYLKLTAANALTGANNLVVGAPGATGNVTFTNSNDFSGSTTVVSGTLTLGDDTADGSFPNTSSIVVEAGATFEFHAFGSVAPPVAISGEGSLRKSGNGTLTLASANSYSGVTLMDAGVLLASDPGAFGTSSIAATAGQVQLSGGITVTNAVRGNSSGLNGSEGVLKSVSGDNTLTDFGFAGTTGTRVNVADGSSLTLPNDFASGNASSLRILGGGTLVLGGDNSGALEGGNLFILGDGSGVGPTVKAGNDAAFGAATITFVLDSPSTLQSADASARTFANSVEFKDLVSTLGADSTGDLTFDGGTITLNSDVSLVIDNALTTFTGPVVEIGGPRSLTKEGTGTLVLDGNTTITGDFAVSEGTLLANATVDAGMVYVDPDGILGGSGTINQDILVSTDGAIAPGSSTGVLSANGGVVFDGSLEIELDGAACDRLDVTGDLDITDGTLNVTTLGGGATQPVYVIATFGTLTGTAFDTENVPSGYTVEYDLINQQIKLVSSAASGFTTWINTNFPSLSDKTPGGDPDFDGKSNLLEYACNTDPGSGTGGSITYVPGGDVTAPGQPVAVDYDAGSGVDFYAVFGRRKDYVAAGLTYTVQFSAGLDEWVDGTDTPTLVTGVASAGDMDAVRVPFPATITTMSGPETPTFFRVQVVETP